MKGMQVGLLIGYRGPEQDGYKCEVFNVAVVIEEAIMPHNFEDVLFSFAFLIGIILNCVNLEYPQEIKYSFEFLQRIVMKIKQGQASAQVTQADS